MSTKKGGASRPWYQATSCARNPLRIETGFENYRGPTTLGGMPMNSSLASADFSKGRPAAERSNKLRLPATLWNLITRIRLWLGKLFSLAFARERSERWAICKYMDQRMWRPEDGGWRARPYEVAVGGAKSAASRGSDLPPLQLIVQFVKADPS